MNATDLIKNLNTIAGTNLVGRVSDSGLSLWGSALDVSKMRVSVVAGRKMKVTRFDDSAARAARNMCVITLNA